MDKYKMNLTHEEKCKAYELGQYVFSAPTVCTAYWDRNSWFLHIGDKGWRVPIEQLTGE